MSESIKVVIADDDRPVLNMLKNYLCNVFEDIEVVGTARGDELLEVVRQTTPDAVFTDIKMPGMDGLNAVCLLQKEFPNLFIVFISAHTHYAIEAFSLDAVDFLSKPINNERLSKTIVKIKRYKALFENSQSVGLFKDQEVSSNRSTHLILKFGHGITLVDKSDIIYVEKQGQKCLFHTTRWVLESACSLASLEKCLREPMFFRCHKSFIINVFKVEKIIPYADRAYRVCFFNYPEAIYIRRNSYEKFCTLFKQAGL